MKRFLALCFMMLCATCANMKQTITETTDIETKDGKGKTVLKPMVRTIVSDSTCQGFGCSTHELAALEVNRQRVVDDGQIGMVAAKKGMPVSRSGNANESTTQTGYQYGGYGAYGAIGNPYGVSSRLMQADAASLGYMPGYLPHLAEAPMYLQPAQPQVVQTPGGGSQRTLEDRMNRYEQNQKAMALKILNKK